MDFKQLKKSSASQFDELNAELEKLNTKSERKNDERFWKPTTDKAKKGYAIIRFLPACAAEAAQKKPPFVRLFEHFFKGPSGSYYVENSLTTLGQPDPVGESNQELWNSGGEGSPERKLASSRKRNLKFISNIYVVQDTLNPSTEGNVYLYKYGKKIFDKIVEARTPDPGEPVVDAFNLWDAGANFAVSIKEVEGYPNYDKSKFLTPGPLADDKKLEAIYKKLYPLQPFLAPENFKSYDELKAKLDRVLKVRGGVPGRATDLDTTEEGARPEKAAPSIPGDDGDDEGLAYFKSLTK